MSDKYFAAKEDKETASILLEKAESFFNDLTKNRYLDKLRLMWKAYHGMYIDGADHEIAFTGEQGELVVLPVNHFRNLARHMLTIITSNRPVMEARAINTDYKSLAQANLANGILDYYMREKHLEDVLVRATEMAIFMGAGFVKLEWNATAGDAYDYDEDSGHFAYEGEVEFSYLSPFDVVIDGTKESWKHEWMLIRSYQNKYNLMAKYPELAEKIQGMPTKNDLYKYRLNLMSNDKTDDIPVYEFYHKKTEAVPDGRYMLFLDSDAVLLDMPLPYDEIPIYRVSAGEIIGTPYGYTDLFDIYPLQEVLNTAFSAIATNQNTFAVSNVFVPEGSNITVESLDGGLNIIKGTAKPEPINLTNTPQEVFKFAEMLVQSMETISGISSVTRGQPEASLRTGTALALVQSMSLQYTSNLQKSYIKLIENVGTGLISILQKYSNTPKLIALVGKNNRTELKEFTGDLIKDVRRVVVDVGNPLAKTIAGRVEMASELLQMKLLKTPEQYFQIIKTGNLDVGFEGTTSQLLNIKKENEMLLEGKKPISTMLDQHSLHIAEHQAVISDPELRENPELVKNVLDHIQGHIDYLRTTDPAILQMIGEQPLPPSPGAQLPPGAGPQGNQPPAASLESTPVPEIMSSVQGSTVPGEAISGPGVENIGQPNLPKPPAPFENLPVTPEGLIPQG